MGMLSRMSVEQRKRTALNMFSFVPFPLFMIDKKKRGATDGTPDGRTDTSSFRDTKMHLKTRSSVRMRHWAEYLARLDWSCAITSIPNLSQHPVPPF